MVEKENVVEKMYETAKGAVATIIAANPLGDSVFAPHPADLAAARERLDKTLSEIFPDNEKKQEELRTQLFQRARQKEIY